MNLEERTQEAISKINGLIAGWCKSNDITSETFAKQMNISTVTLSYKRNGKREWTLNELAKMAQIFNVSLEDLITNK